MAEKKQLKPYADVKARVREYTDKDGKTKGVYEKVGTLFATPHLSHMALKIDSIPVGNEWNGWVSVFKREDFIVEEIKQKEDEEVDIPLDDIPF